MTPSSLVRYCKRGFGMGWRIAVRIGKAGQYLCMFITVLCGVAFFIGLATGRCFPSSFLFFQWGLCFAFYGFVLRYGTKAISAVKERDFARLRWNVKGVACSLLGIMLIGPLCSVGLLLVESLSGSFVPFSISFSFEPSAVASSSVWLSSLNGQTCSSAMPIEIDLPLLVAALILLFSSGSSSNREMQDDAAE